MLCLVLYMTLPYGGESNVSGGPRLLNFHLGEVLCLVLLTRGLVCPKVRATPRERYARQYLDRTNMEQNSAIPLRDKFGDFPIQSQPISQPRYQTKVWYGVKRNCCSRDTLSPNLACMGLDKA